jgi:uncharacterized protein YndB with AHSA1/START domain
MMTTITVQTTIAAPLDVVWSRWTNPNDIVKWNFASDDWHSPKAENNLTIGGKFSFRMEAKDGSDGFDFSGIHVRIQHLEFIDSLLDDGRKLLVSFSTQNGETTIKEEFDAEDINSIELQQYGWQSILNSFKKYVESQEIKI